MRKQLTILLLLSLMLTMIPQETVDAETLFIDSTRSLSFGDNLEWFNVTVAKDFDALTGTPEQSSSLLIVYRKDAISLYLLSIHDVYGSSQINYPYYTVDIFNDTRYLVEINTTHINFSVHIVSYFVQEYYINNIFYGTVYGYNFDFGEFFIGMIGIWKPTHLVEINFGMNTVTTSTMTETITETSTSTISTTETSTETQTETNTETETTTEVITSVDSVTNTYITTETWWEGTTITDSVTETFNIVAIEYTTIVVTSTEDDDLGTIIIYILIGIGLSISALAIIGYRSKDINDVKIKLPDRGSGWCGGCEQENEAGSGWCINCGMRLN